jgi:hypothetical protein
VLPSQDYFKVKEKEDENDEREYYYFNDVARIL